VPTALKACLPSVCLPSKIDGIGFLCSIGVGSALNQLIFVFRGLFSELGVL
jgi:hypothetical protein